MSAPTIAPRTHTNEAPAGGTKDAADAVVAESEAPDAQKPETVIIPVAAAAHLSARDIEEIGAELDALRQRIIAERGASDAQYIRRVVTAHRVLEVAGRGTLLFSRFKPAWVAGVGMLTVAKILENMEIGHNVLHGQWDWMRDPDIHSTTWEWDFVAPSKGWKHTHNDVHHTYTNVVGKDRDVGYNLLRMDDEQPWKPWNLGNPVYNLLLAPLFEWGIAIYDLELDEVQAGRKSKKDLFRDLRSVGGKLFRQSVKDYGATPALAMLTGSGKHALAGTVTANALRNVWAHAVIFCGHFPDGAETFTEEDIEGETRGQWYVRQMLGSANISGSGFMHFMTGNLSHQIEHHLFPDLPSNRLAQISVEVRALCEKYRLPYTTGPLVKQVGSAWKKVCRLALP